MNLPAAEKVLELISEQECAQIICTFSELPTMSTKNIAEGGLEPVVEAPATLLSDVLKEGVAAIKTRGYAILPLTATAREAIDRMRLSQQDFFSVPREVKKQYVQCHAVQTHGISEVADLKFYFQARAGGPQSALPFPAATSSGATDFGIDVTDVYTQLDLLGRACLAELAPTLNIPLARILQLLDPLGPTSLNLEKMTPAEILALKFKSTREEDAYVATDLFVQNTFLRPTWISFIITTLKKLAKNGLSITLHTPTRDSFPSFPSPPFLPSISSIKN